MREVSRSGLAPEILAERAAGDCIDLDLRVPEQLDVWPGHFPGYPLVPGVLQLDWVMRFAADRLGAGTLASVEVMKFKARMRPGQRFTLALSLVRKGRELSFRLEHGGQVFSVGRLTLEPRSV